MKITLMLFFGLLFLEACTSSQFAMYRPKNSDKQWNISANKAPFSNKITIAVNDSVVIAESPGLLSYSFEAKGLYQGHEVKMYSVYNNGFLGIGSGWETTIFVDNELAAKIKL